MRVWVMWAVVAHGEVAVDVHVAFELGKLFVEPVGFHAVLDPLEGFILLLNLSDDGSSVNLELGGCWLYRSTLVKVAGCSRLWATSARVW